MSLNSEEQAHLDNLKLEKLRREKARREVAKQSAPQDPVLSDKTVAQPVPGEWKQDPIGLGAQRNIQFQTKIPKFSPDGWEKFKSEYAARLPNEAINVASGLSPFADELYGAARGLGTAVNSVPDFLMGEGQSPLNVYKSNYKKGRDDIRYAQQEAELDGLKVGGMSVGKLVGSMMLPFPGGKGMGLVPKMAGAAGFGAYSALGESNAEGLEEQLADTGFSGLATGLVAGVLHAPGALAGRVAKKAAAKAEAVKASDLARKVQTIMENEVKPQAVLNQAAGAERELAIDKALAARAAAPDADSIKLIDEALAAMGFDATSRGVEQAEKAKLAADRLLRGQEKLQSLKDAVPAAAAAESERALNQSIPGLALDKMKGQLPRLYTAGAGAALGVLFGGENREYWAPALALAGGGAGSQGTYKAIGNLIKSPAMSYQVPKITSAVAEFAGSASDEVGKRIGSFTAQASKQNGQNAIELLSAYLGQPPKDKEDAADQHFLLGNSNADYQNRLNRK